MQQRIAEYLCRLTGARAYRQVDWQRVSRLTFVCKGNIARSAYAAARARSLGLSANSFGVETHDDKPADPPAVRVAAERGIDLATHRTTTMQSARFDGGDLLLAMEPYQANAVRRRVRHDASLQVTLMGLWCQPPQLTLADPFGRGEQAFRACFASIDEALDTIQGKLSRR